jgi:hypothetical protein
VYKCNGRELPPTSVPDAAFKYYGKPKIRVDYGLAGGQRLGRDQNTTSWMYLPNINEAKSLKSGGIGEGIMRGKLPKLD